MFDLLPVLFVAAIAFVAACTDEDDGPPSCAELGCPDAPSGSPDEWSPCLDGECYCREQDDVTACEAT
jgi:hypothetical protein